MAKATYPVGGELKATLDTTTDNHSLEIDGTKFALIPIQIESDGNVSTYYMIAAEGWDWNAKT